MANKTKTITLTYGFRLDPATPINLPLGYRVECITNSTEFNPGTIISKQQADQLCDAKDWKVTITCSL